MVGGRMDKDRLDPPRLICEFRIANDVIKIWERQLPDLEVQVFLDTLDAHARKYYRHQPNKDEEIQWFAMLGDRIVGYGSLSGNGPSVVFGCVIHQDFRGQGLGKVMYRTASEMAYRHRKQFITAEQDEGNEAAKAICEREGFDFTGPYDDPTSSSGKIVRLTKEIR